MKPRFTSLLPFAALSALGVVVARPTTVVEVTPVAGYPTPVHGWTRIDGASDRSALEPRTAPFRMIFRGAGFRARFVTELDGPEIQVQAVRKRGWLPVIRVDSQGSAISLEGGRNHLGISSTGRP